MDDRRKFLRFIVGVEVTWKKISGDERTALHISRSKDLSTGGVCLVLDSSIEPGDLLRLEITLSGKPPLHANGRVAWVNRQAKVPSRKELVCEGGIEFIGLTDSDKAQIDQLIFRSIKDASRK